MQFLLFSNESKYLSDNPDKYYISGQRRLLRRKGKKMKFLILLIMILSISCGAEHETEYEQLTDDVENYDACNRFIDDIQSASELETINAIVLADSDLWHCKQVENNEGDIVYVFLGCDSEKRLWITWKDLRYYERLGFEACVERYSED